MLGQALLPAAMSLELMASGAAMLVHGNPTAPGRAEPGALLVGVTLPSPLRLGGTAPLRLLVREESVSMESGGHITGAGSVATVAHAMVASWRAPHCQAAPNPARAAVLCGISNGPSGPSSGMLGCLAGGATLPAVLHAARVDAGLHLGATIAARMTVPVSFGAVAASPAILPPWQCHREAWVEAGDFQAAGHRGPASASFGMRGSSEARLIKVQSKPLSTTAAGHDHEGSGRSSGAQEVAHMVYITQWQAQDAGVAAATSRCAALMYAAAIRHHQQRERIDGARQHANLHPNKSAAQETLWLAGDSAFNTAQPAAALALLQTLSLGVGPLTSLSLWGCSLQPQLSATGTMARVAARERPGGIQVHAAGGDLHAVGSRSFVRPSGGPSIIPPHNDDDDDDDDDGYGSWRGAGGVRMQPRLLPWVGPGEALRGDDVGASHGAALVTGGLGELGGLVMRHLAMTGRHTAIHVLGRRRRANALAPLESTSLVLRGLLTLTLADVSVWGDLLEVPTLQTSATLEPTLSLFHAGGVLADAPLAAHRPAQLRELAAPKAGAGIALLRSTSVLPVLVTALFASTSATLSPPGQAGYAAANAELGALAARASDRGLPVLSVQWGAWVVGMAARSPALLARLDRIGVGLVRPAAGLRALQRLLIARPGGAPPDVLASPFHWGRMAAAGEGQVRPAVFELAAEAQGERQGPVKHEGVVSRVDRPHADSTATTPPMTASSRVWTREALLAEILLILATLLPTEVRGVVVDRKVFQGSWTQGRDVMRAGVPTVAQPACKLTPPVQNPPSHVHRWQRTPPLQRRAWTAWRRWRRATCWRAAWAPPCRPPSCLTPRTPQRSRLPSRSRWLSAPRWCPWALLTGSLHWRGRRCDQHPWPSTRPLRGSPRLSATRRVRGRG